MELTIGNFDLSVRARLPMPFAYDPSNPHPVDLPVVPCLLTVIRQREFGHSSEEFTQCGLQ
jgi:hypothetical protein